jgi:hypothetical protein
MSSHTRLIRAALDRSRCIRYDERRMSGWLAHADRFELQLGAPLAYVPGMSRGVVSGSRSRRSVSVR